MSLSNKVLLYIAVLRPILSYASPVWGYAAKSNIKILAVSQNLLIRRITKPGCETFGHMAREASLHPISGNVVVELIAECRWAYGSRSEPPSHIINGNGAWES
ncbi:hypothetical protein TNCV_2438181 [Trichonephila clavipes]|nr:hypothetical protein TNCV_2438181 [Trichonephila clavipes]